MRAKLCIKGVTIFVNLFIGVIYFTGSGNLFFWNILSTLGIYLYENSSAKIEYNYLISVVYNRCTDKEGVEYA
mgnify:FL=1